MKTWDIDAIKKNKQTEGQGSEGPFAPAHEFVGHGHRQDHVAGDHDLVTCQQAVEIWVGDEFNLRFLAFWKDKDATSTDVFLSFWKDKDKTW